MRERPLRDLWGILGMKMWQYLSFGDALGCRSAPRGDVEVHYGVTLARHLSQWRQYLHRFMDVGPKKGALLDSRHWRE